jgi:large subunit ribosomal protein L9
LFGSLGTVDIAEAAAAAGVEINRSEVRLPEGPLRSVGKHAVTIHLHSDLNVDITVNVIGQDDGMGDPTAEPDDEAGDE